jgi:hypothetical protein
MNLAPKIVQYLGAALGLSGLTVTSCPNAERLPFYLQDNFEFGRLDFFDRQVVLISPKEIREHSLREIRVRIDRVTELLGAPVILCLEQLVAYERRNLIAQKLSFMVPGNQLYLPHLGIDLREYFSKVGHATTTKYSPSTQALLFWQLLNSPVLSEWSPSDDAVVLGYTHMTATRAIRELVGSGLAELKTVGRRKNLRLIGSRAQAWSKAKPFLRSPVKRTLWATGPLELRSTEIRLAGLSALAKHSMIEAPKDRCLAVTLEQWQSAQSKGLKEIPGPELAAYQVEIWAYETGMQSNSTTVDPLSLWLSLRDSNDERVQLALVELEGKFPW